MEWKIMVVIVFIAILFGIIVVIFYNIASYLRKKNHKKVNILFVQSDQQGIELQDYRQKEKNQDNRIKGEVQESKQNNFQQEISNRDAKFKQRIQPRSQIVPTSIKADLQKKSTSLQDSISPKDSSAPVIVQQSSRIKPENNKENINTDKNNNKNVNTSFLDNSQSENCLSNRNLISQEQNQSNIENLEQKIDCEKINGPEFSHMIQRQNEIYYGKFEQDEKPHFFQGNWYGKHYQVKYDPMWNPNFQIYKGEFLDEKRHGNGILYGGKSTEILYQGLWINDKQQPIEQPRETEKSNCTDPVPKMRIIIRENDEIVNNNPISQLPPPIRTWIMFNQQLNENDMKILKSSSAWFTSSIIDAFALFLNIYDEQKFFQITDQKIRKNRQRVLFLPSTIFTSIHEGQTKSNQDIFQKHLLEFEPINFQIERIYEKIFFVINQSFHWFLVQIDLNKKTMNVFDSIQKSQKSYEDIFYILNDLFGNKLRKIELVTCDQQNNGYDCGPCTCLNMLRQTNYDIEMKVKFPKDMRLLLQDILKKE